MYKWEEWPRFNCLDGKNDPLVISRNLLTDTSFMAALDVLAKSRKQESAEGMNEVFKEIEEQRQV